MQKFRKILEELSEEDLEILDKELRDGSLHKQIEARKEFFKIRGRMCPVCGNNVTEDCFVLIWGEPSIRKKAHFCEQDCLEYFINNFIKKKPKIKKSK